MQVASTLFEPDWGGEAADAVLVVAGSDISRREGAWST